MAYRDDEEDPLVDQAPVAPPPPAPAGSPAPAPTAGAAAEEGGGRRNRGGGGGAPDLGPQYNIPGLPGFVAPEWVAPTLEQAMAEPGYAFRLQSGQDALQRSAAARGVLRSGGTLQDLVKYGQEFGQQEFGNVYNRALQAYDRRYQGAKDAYAPQLAKWQTLAQLEGQRALAVYNRANRGGGGGGGGGMPPMDVLLGPPPAPPDYAHTMTAPQVAAPQAGAGGGGMAGDDFYDDRYAQY